MAFTPKELSIAKKVIVGSKTAKAWAKGKAEAFGVDITTPDGQAYYDKTKKLFADRFLKGATG